MRSNRQVHSCALLLELLKDYGDAVVKITHYAVVFVCALRSSSSKAPCLHPAWARSRHAALFGPKCVDHEAVEKYRGWLKEDLLTKLCTGPDWQLLGLWRPEAQIL